MKSLKNFLIYNNTVPIVLGVIFLGTTATFAASEEAREVVVDSQERLVSVDNSYLLSSAITEDTVQIRVESITEDDEYYYIEYSYTTISVVDGVWQPVTEIRTFDIEKSSIIGKDLGLHLAEELGENQVAEVRRLKQRQNEERQVGNSVKAVVTEYSGVIGRYFDPDLQTFPNYNPLVSATPLTREQEAEHQAKQERLQAQSESTVITTNTGNIVNVPPINTGSGNSGGGQSEPDVVATTTEQTASTTEPINEPTASSTEPTPEPTASTTEPASEPPATTTPPAESEVESESEPETPAEQPTPEPEPEPAPEQTTEPEPQQQAESEPESAPEQQTETTPNT